MNLASETPRELSDIDNEEWHESPVIPTREFTPNTNDRNNQKYFNQDPWLADTTSLGNPSDTESSNAIDFPDEDEGTILHPQSTSAMWKESLGRESPVGSEGSWLSGGRKDIEKAVRKSFKTTSPRYTPPIILEASTLPPVMGASPSKIDTITAAAMNVQTSSSASKLDFEEIVYESDTGDNDEIRIQTGERVRQGSAARKVEVVNRPTVEGFVRRISGESVRREEGDIILV